MKKFLQFMLAALLLVHSATGEASGKFIFGDTSFNPENEILGLDPRIGYSGWACVRYGVGETLFRYSETMEAEPWLASGYRLLDDHTWEITIRDGICFSNGKAVDAHAAMKSLESLINVSHRARSDLRISSMSADGQVLTVKTEVPRPTLLNSLSDPYSCIIDTDIHDGSGAVTGTGPYKCVSVSVGKEASLARNDLYWGKKPEISEIRVRTISDGDALTLALQSGAIDAAYGLPYVSLPLFQNSRYKINSTATSRAFFLSFNFKSDVLEPAVRKAAAMAIEKTPFTDVLMGGNGIPAQGAFPSGFSFSNKYSNGRPYSPEEAQKILTDAGWIDTDADGIREKNGRKLELRLITYPSRQELPLLAEYVQAALKKVGMNVSVRITQDIGRARDDTSSWDIYASAMVTCPTGDPEYFFTSCTLASSPANYGSYKSLELEQFAAELSETFDTDRRRELGGKMMQILLDDDAFVFCAHLKMSIVSRSSITGLKVHPSDFYEITSELKAD